jgi:hypothetical protein
MDLVKHKFYLSSTRDSDEEIQEHFTNHDSDRDCEVFDVPPSFRYSPNSAGRVIDTLRALAFSTGFSNEHSTLACVSISATNEVEVLVVDRW